MAYFKNGLLQKRPISKIGLFLKNGLFQIFCRRHNYRKRDVFFEKKNATTSGNALYKDSWNILKKSKNFKTNYSRFRDVSSPVANPTSKRYVITAPPDDFPLVMSGAKKKQQFFTIFLQFFYIFLQLRKRLCFKKFFHKNLMIKCIFSLPLKSSDLVFCLMQFDYCTGMCYTVIELCRNFREKFELRRNFSGNFSKRKPWYKRTILV